MADDIVTAIEVAQREQQVARPKRPGMLPLNPAFAMGEIVISYHYMEVDNSPRGFLPKKRPELGMIVGYGIGHVNEILYYVKHFCDLEQIRDFEDLQSPAVALVHLEKVSDNWSLLYGSNWHLKAWKDIHNNSSKLGK